MGERKNRKKWKMWMWKWKDENETNVPNVDGERKNGGHATCGPSSRMKWGVNLTDNRCTKTQKKNGGKWHQWIRTRMKLWQGMPAIKNDRKWIGVREKHTQNQNGGLHKTTPGQSQGGNSQETSWKCPHSHTLPELNESQGISSGIH
jgi:hypothetical protein